MPREKGNMSLKSVESQNVEFKSAWRDEYLKVICAFTNADGTFEKLKEPHSSYPRNELLADIFFKAGFIEAWGRGTIKIIDKCKERNLPEPDFSEMTGGFLVSFFKPKTTKKKKEKYGESSDKFLRKYGETGKERTAERVPKRVTKKVTKKVTENQSTILSVMRKNLHITVKELADIVGISERKIKENINKLKKINLLEREGPARSGYWKVYRRD